MAVCSKTFAIFEKQNLLRGKILNFADYQRWAGLQSKMKSIKFFKGTLWKVFGKCVNRYLLKNTLQALSIKCISEILVKCCPLISAICRYERQFLLLVEINKWRQCWQSGLFWPPELEENYSFSQEKIRWKYRWHYYSSHLFQILLIRLILCWICQ